MDISKSTLSDVSHSNLICAMPVCMIYNWGDSACMQLMSRINIIVAIGTAQKITQGE